MPFGSFTIFVIASASRILSSVIIPADFIASYTFDARSDVSSGMPLSPSNRRGSPEDLNKVSSVFILPMTGACKDVLADLITKFGRPPIIPRTIPVDAGKIKEEWKVAAWVAGGLVFDDRGRVALVKHRADSGWEDVWVPPGGTLEDGETADDGFRREVREETGLEVEELHVTRIFNNAYAEPGGKRYPFYFVQFVARAAGTALHPDDSEVREARWFDGLPKTMAFIDDYAEDYRMWRERLLEEGDVRNHR